MLKLSGKTIESLYLKNKTINKAYVNGKLIFNKTKLTKPYYCEVEYLESTGTQFIDTDVYSKDINYIEVEAQYTKINARQVLLGCYTSQAWNTFGATNVTSVYQNFFIQWINAGDYGGSVVCDTNKHLFVFDKKSKKFSVDGSIYMLEEIYDVNDTLYMFSSHSGSTIDRQAFARIYRVKLKNNDNLVRDYIPVLDFDMQPCLYDKVSGKLFYNQGTGEFLYPPVELEYIESTGTQWIDSGISPTNQTKWEIKFAFTKETTGQLMGAGHAGNYRFNIGIESDKFRFAIGSGWTTLVETKDTDIHTWVLNSENNSGSLDDTTVISTYSSDFSTTDYHIIFCNRAVGLNYCSIKIYGSKIYDNDTLVRDFMPCLLNGEAGLWDKINNVFYPNSGTEKFLYKIK